jgi:hypothetical protein
MPKEPPDLSNLVTTDCAIAAESMLAMFSNNRLRVIASDIGESLTKQKWFEFIAVNRDVVVKHREYWGLDVSDGWEERSWNKPEEELYDIADAEQLEYAKSKSDVACDQITEQNQGTTDGKTSESE